MRALQIFTYVVRALWRAPMQIMAAELMIAGILPKKQAYAGRVAGILAIMAIIQQLPFSLNNLLFAVLYFAAIFAISVGGLYFCYDAPVDEILVAALIGYCLQNLSTSIYQLFLPFLNILPVAWYDIVQTIIILIVCATTFAIVQHLFRIKCHDEQEFRMLVGRRIIAFSALVLAVVIVLNWLIGNDISDPGQFFGSKLTLIVCDMLVLIMQLDLLERGQLQRELDTTIQLWHRDRERYQMEKQNIDLINLKYHDLKHIINRLSRTADGRYQEEVEHSAHVFDQIYHTGNEALDVVLTEKAFNCEKNDISFTCIANGDALAHMQDVDIYSLLGNALDNAIEATCKVVNPDQRVISCSIGTQGNMSCIHIENSFRGPLVFNNGLPQTSKKDRQYHGYGMKSMKLIVERYGGTMSISTDKEIFLLNIMLAAA